MEIKVRNVSQALTDGIAVVQKYGAERPSRNGPVKAMDEPMIITYERPEERVIFYPQRDANPFFHLYECVWMIAGRRDVASVAEYVPSMRNYSDNGRQFNAAYGYRWRKYFGVDQLRIVVDRLRQEGAVDDRRTYMGMWAPARDTQPSLDLPCNVGIAFRCRSDGTLDMTVFNRSNDLVLGATGANAVHMSFLHELVARAANLTIGKYHQVSNDMHFYIQQEKTAPCLGLAGSWSPQFDPYASEEVTPYPIMEIPFEEWLVDLELFMQYGNVVALRDRFFKRVLGPVVNAHKFYSKHTGHERYEGALDILDQCIAPDWKKACVEWVERRYVKWKEKAE